MAEEIKMVDFEIGKVNIAKLGRNGERAKSFKLKRKVEKAEKRKGKKIKK